MSDTALSDASNLSIQLALGKLVGKVSTGISTTVSTSAVFSELKRRGRVQIALPDSLNPADDLTERLHTMAGEAQTDSKGRKFRLTKTGRGDDGVFDIRFTAPQAGLLTTDTPP